MKSLTTGICTAAALALGLTVFAQEPQPQPQPSQAPRPQTSVPDKQPAVEAGAQEVTVTGCVQAEEDYRKAHGQGKGGAAGSGVGVGNEFIIIAMRAPAAPGASPGAAGTTGAAGQAYEVTGAKEGDLKQYVGQRVEVTGKAKRAERSASGAPTGGPTAAATDDLKLPEIEIANIKPASGECKPM